MTETNSQKEHRIIFELLESYFKGKDILRESAYNQIKKNARVEADKI